MLLYRQMISQAKTVLALIPVLFASACATMKTEAPEPVSLPEPATVVYLDEYNQLHYEGYLEADANQRLYSHYANAQIKPEVLVISSEGGSVTPGLDLGDWVYDKGLVVIVEGVCASSCANYVFTAARQKGLKKDSVLIWHGSSLQKDVDELYRQGDSNVVAWRQREVSFFKKIDVDHQITIYGLERYPFRVYLGSIMMANPIEGFDFSIEDMAKFGVTDVYPIEGEWNWRKYTNCCNVVRMQLN